MTPSKMFFAKKGTSRIAQTIADEIFNRHRHRDDPTRRATDISRPYLEDTIDSHLAYQERGVKELVRTWRKKPMNNTMPEDWERGYQRGQVDAADELQAAIEGVKP